ncbi:amidohydrolase family protein [Zavarzinia sp. CC-PAN008]|uniref:amidohydrolase family protein n=1 Tax=Zavarzinia sp. CC-PAN008 TaxID=3243332 RepID=UPI003F7423F6
MAGLIDVHCHVMPGRFPAAPPDNPRWPCLHCHSAVDVTLMIDGKPFRRVDDRSWDTERRLADMEREGVAVQVLSPMPELLSYWFATGDAQILCDHVNGDMAEMIARAPQRFRGLGMVPMQDVPAAVAMMRDLGPRFGLSGIEIGSNINGIMLGDPRFDPVWEAAEALDLAVFVHALHPVATKAIGADPAFTAFVGFPIDVGMAAASLIMANVPARFPRLRLGFSHGGGALLPIVRRMDKGWSITNGFGGTLASTPSTLAAGLYYDSNVYDGRYLAQIAQDLAPGRIMLGTDYPYPLMQEGLGAYLESSGLAAGALADIGSGAAQRFLGE